MLKIRATSGSNADVCGAYEKANASPATWSGVIVAVQPSEIYFADEGGFMLDASDQHSPTWVASVMGKYGPSGTQVGVMGDLDFSGTVLRLKR